MAISKFMGLIFIDANDLVWLELQQQIQNNIQNDLNFVRGKIGFLFLSLQVNISIRNRLGFIALCRPL